MKIERLEDEIQTILEYNEPARADDMTLYCDYVFRHVKDEGLGVGWLVKVFSDRKYRATHGIHGYESVSRVRRKLQADYPELRPSAEAIAIRKMHNKTIKEYARGERC